MKQIEVMRTATVWFSPDVLWEQIHRDIVQAETDGLAVRQIAFSPEGATFVVYEDNR